MQQKENNFLPEIILLDVYETILDMSDVERRVNHLLNSKRGYALWFELFMQYTFVDNSIVQFHDFASIAGATLEMTARMLDRKIDADDTKSILEMMKHLPIKENVQEGLSELHDQNFRIAALTNSPEKLIRERMQLTGLISYFENVLSAENVGKYKPAIEVYQWTAEKLKVSVNAILLVTSHGWDIAGGKNAGMQIAYIRQDKQMLYPLAPDPDFICNNLVDLSDQLKQLSINTVGNKI